MRSVIDAITSVILVENASRIATIPQFWISRRRFRLRKKRRNQRAGGETGFVLGFLPPLALPSITRRRGRTKMREATCVTSRSVFGGTNLLSYGYACIRSTLSRQTLQREALGGVIHENMPFVRLQFT